MDRGLRTRSVTPARATLMWWAWMLGAFLWFCVAMYLIYEVNQQRVRITALEQRERIVVDFLSSLTLVQHDGELANALDLLGGVELREEVRAGRPDHLSRVVREHLARRTMRQ